MAIGSGPFILVEGTSPKIEDDRQSDRHRRVPGPYQDPQIEIRDGLSEQDTRPYQKGRDALFDEGPDVGVLERPGFWKTGRTIPARRRGKRMPAVLFMSGPRYKGGRGVLRERAARSPRLQGRPAGSGDGRTGTGGRLYVRRGGPIEAGAIFEQISHRKGTGENTRADDGGLHPDSQETLIRTR